ncbi:MAG: hypothetical protein WAV67_12155 [Dokdonella sp.]
MTSHPDPASAETVAGVGQATGSEKHGMLVALSGRDANASLIARVVSRLLIGWLILAGLWYAMTSLVAIANYAWPQLAFDQFRSYTHYLGMPFPDNVLVMENGHRPIIPALLRVAEIHLFAANQYLQIAFGTFFAILTASVIAVTAWRETSSDALVRAAGVMLALVGIFWLANARMLLHGTESEHVYLVMFCGIAGSLMVRRAVSDDRAGWMVGAAIACMLATFSFAGGVALFPTFLALAWMLGARWRHILIIVAVAVLCLGLYLFVLAGNGSVRQSLDFRPLDSMVVSARWLASPWITGWLGLADSQPLGFVINTPLGLAMTHSAKFLQSLLHVEWKSSGATLIGSVGLTIMVASVVAKARRRGPMTATRTLAFALMMFAAATAGLIGVGRLDYLEKIPEQVFSDRYLVWPCLFWLGIGLMLLSLANARRPWLRDGLLAFSCMLPIALFSFQQYGAGWGASVYHMNQAGAAAAMSDLFDDRLFQTGDDATLAQRVLSYRLLREGHLGPFRYPGSEELGHLLAANPVAAPANISVFLQKTFAVTDARDGSNGARFEGVVAAGIRAIQARGPLAVIDPDRRIVGYAMFSNVGKPMRTLGFSMPLKRGFDGYVKNYAPAVRYRLVSLDSNGIQGITWNLGELSELTP